ncbi:MAG: cysteine--tRNA ligase [Actinomycetota bacterium]|nr:cysteine--tRNA ligase [Actinomycetota bacterium]
MPIQVYDSMARRAVPFQPRDEGKVGIYCCGMTVYNFAHIGNMRTIIWFDLIRRYLAYRGFDVTFVMNYTDVDDKIIERANLEGLSPDEITAKYEQAFEEDLKGLGGREPDVLPRATTHIDEMIEAISGLVEKGIAYAAEGNVWFSVESFDGYGKLSGRSLDDMRAGERVEPHPGKRHPLDFSLWKAAKEGEPAWESPWGPGRPGWHIECSVMSDKYLGMGFDIHGGGSDLIFPHHENEIAQAEALAGTEPFARYWLHAGMVQMESEKMSKSLGNVALAREVLQRYQSEAVRYWMLQGSYRSQVVFSEGALEDATQSYERWRTFIMSARDLLDELPSPPRERTAGEKLADAPAAVGGFIAAMDDDFNSAEAFAAIHELVREGNKALTDAQSGTASARDELSRHVASFLELTGVLGFAFPEPEGAGSELAGELIEYLLERRDRARANRDFAEADEIRAKLTDLGVLIEDTPTGARWRISAASN